MKSKGEKSMSMKRVLQSVIALSVLMVLAAPSWSATVGINLTGTPTSAKQGETKSFTINISATGQTINIAHVPATVTVDTAYTAGGGSGVPDRSSTFSAPSSVSEGCNTFDSGSNAGQCKPTQNMTGGPFALTANVIVPISLIPGTYTITVVATAGNGLDLPNPLPSFDLIVTEAGAAPSVSIITPENSGSYLVNQAITPAAEVSNSPSSVTGALNTATPVAFVDTGEDHIWQAPAPLTLTIPGTNTYKVTAENSFGRGEATSTFNVHYNFSGWLPPITTAKFQRGRTLPVKFRVNDYSGPTSLAVASVYLDKDFVGFADFYYDSLGLPYYQLEVKLDVLAGPHQIRVELDDKYTGESYAITVK